MRRSKPHAVHHQSGAHQNAVRKDQKRAGRGERHGLWHCDAGHRRADAGRAGDRPSGRTIRRTPAGPVSYTHLEEYSDTVPAGAVISQNPVSGTPAKWNDPVSIVVSKGAQERTIYVHIAVDETNEGGTYTPVSYTHLQAISCGSPRWRSARTRPPASCLSASRRREYARCWRRWRISRRARHRRGRRMTPRPRWRRPLQRCV